jgi:hypothetical protein
MVELESLLTSSSLARRNKAWSEFFRRETLKWSFLKKSLGDVCFFREKVHSLSVAPEPLTIWNKKLEGLESSELKKLKNLS